MWRMLTDQPSPAIENVKTAPARQRHNALLENYTDAQVASLVAYLATGQLG